MNNFSLEKFRAQTVPSEQDIMANWTESGVLVSIICVAYNHSPYIEDAIRGFLLQKTSFPLEIIIHDDASSDNTPDIIRQYIKRYPKLIRGILQTENQFSKGARILFNEAQHAKGEYIAQCEGDDFWIDRDKLQLQVDAFNAHPESEICFHSAIQTVKEIPEKQIFCKRAHGDAVIDAAPIIEDGGAYMPTAAMLIRKRFFDRAFQAPGDFYIKYSAAATYQILCAIAGGALYIDRPMSVYRLYSEGSWSQKVYSKPDAFIAHVNHYFTVMNQLNALTDYRFDKEFKASFKKYHLSVLNNTQLDLTYRREYFKGHKQELEVFGQILWYCLFQFPLVHALAKKLRTFVKACIGRPA